MDRWKNWKRCNPLCLILALALVVCPATRAFAYTVTGVVVGNSGTPLYYVSSGEATVYPNPDQSQSVNLFRQQLLVLGSDCSLYIRLTNTENINTGEENYQKQYVNCRISINPLNFTGWQYEGFEFILGDVYNDDTDYRTEANIISYYVASNYIDLQLEVKGINLRQVIELQVLYKLRFTYKSTGASSFDSIIGQKWYSGTIIQSGIGNAAGAINYGSSKNPYLYDIKNRVKAILTYQEGIYTDVHSISNAIGSNTTAGDTIQNANQNFIQDAAQLESHQAILENAADASVAAIDMNQVNMIDTYSQSVSFWGQLIGQLPTVLGSIWYVFIFGLLIAFVLFVLRIRR